MPLVTHRVGGIVFCTDSDIDIPMLTLGSRFLPFIAEGVPPDVWYEYREVSAEQVSLPCLGDSEKALLASCLSGPADTLDCPLLCAPVVLQCIRDCLSRAVQTRIEIRESCVTIFDFAERRSRLFYTPALRGGLATSRMEPMFFAQFMPLFDAALLHSSAIIRGARAALFVAPDEGGKTPVVQSAPADSSSCRSGRTEGGAPQAT